VNHRVAADQFSGQAESGSGNFTAFCALRRESQKISRGDSRRKNRPALRRKLPECGGAWQTLAERRLPGAVVDPFAQAFDDPLSRQARQRLRHGHKWEVPEVFEPPQPFTAAFNPPADRNCDAGAPSHVSSIGFHDVFRQFFMQ
jgi:acyl transferase domain-containing protein